MRPSISLVIAAYNEESLLADHLQVLYDYMETFASDQREWELILINDGSSDQTGKIAETFTKEHPKVKVFHHRDNLGLGASLRDGFSHSKGEFVVTLDSDLSYSPDHIERLCHKLEETEADIVIASPNMKGGKMIKVPFYRKWLSRGANRFLSYISAAKLSNLTGMARAYQGKFIRSLSLRSNGMEIMPEIIHKALILDAKIVEIPGVLDWTLQIHPQSSRVSSMRILHHTAETFLTGFLLRPFIFFLLPGLLLLIFAIYPNFWMFHHFFEEYGNVEGTSILNRSSLAIRAAYQLHPHTFLISLVSLLLAIQLIALGFQSIQNKYYFEEMFNLMTKSKRKDNG